MDRSSSSRQLARSERISTNSPYKRPQQQQESHRQARSSANNAFPSLRSIYSFVTAPFSRQPLLPQTNQDVPIEEDQRSQSGSEDGWNGSPPAGMGDQDLFSVAAAGGRSGEEFEQRAIDYRDSIATTSVTKVNAIASTSLLPTHHTPSDQRETLKMNTTSTRTPAYQTLASSSAKRPLSSSITEASHRKPLPSFLPTAQTATTPPQSAASVAFTAFVEAKKGQTMTPEDMRVMRTLMENIEAEQRGSAAGAIKSGGWSAGRTDSPRPVKSAPNGLSNSNAAPSTPNRLVESVRASGGPLFTPGSPGGRSDAGSGVGDSPASRRIRYLGPGMSPRRMLNKGRSAEKPAFTTDVAEQSEPKRQRLDVDEDMPQATTNQTSATGSPMQIDTPTPTPPKPRNIEKTKSTATPARPSPLGQSPADTRESSPRDEKSIAQGKKRAADIVKELMREEIGPIESLDKRDYIVINPYDLASPSAASQKSDTSSTLSRSISRTATPKKSILRSSLRSSTSTPLSGAAAKLEAHKPGRKLTTLELLEGKKPWVGPIVDETMRSQTPSPSRDAIEVDELMEESSDGASERSPSPSPAPAPDVSTARTSTPLPKMPEPFKTPAFKAPEISSPARPIPSFAPSPSPHKTQPPAPVQPSKPAETPVFKLAPSKPSEPLAEIENSTLASITQSSKSSTKRSSASVFTAAQDKVLKIASASLPSFAFKVEIPRSTIDSAARSAALSRPTKAFTFDLTATSSSKSAATAPISTLAADWTCHMCMLKNPDSAKDKCTICESPRPAGKTTKPSAPASASSSTSTSATADWTCGTCMLKNPASAKEKCTICEAPRPATSASAAQPSSSNGMFTFGQQPKQKAAERKAGPWTCDLCMLQNPESATEKCQICEAKRP